MALQTFKQDILTDLVAHEDSPYDGYARRVVNVTLGANAIVKMGTVVFRTASIDQTLPYAPVTPANAATALVDGNELAVVFGDKFGAKTEFTNVTAGNAPCVSFVRGEVQLKDHLLMDNCGITSRTSAEYKALKGILELQGVIIETTLGHVPAGL